MAASGRNLTRQEVFFYWLCGPLRRAAAPHERAFGCRLLRPDQYTTAGPPCRITKTPHPAGFSRSGRRLRGAVAPGIAPMVLRSSLANDDHAGCAGGRGRPFRFPDARVGLDRLLKMPPPDPSSGSAARPASGGLSSAPRSLGKKRRVIHGRPRRSPAFTAKPAAFPDQTGCLLPSASAAYKGYRSRTLVFDCKNLCELKHNFAPGRVTYSMDASCFQPCDPTVQPTAPAGSGASPGRVRWVGEGDSPTVRRLRRWPRTLPLNSCACRRIIVLVAAAGAMYSLFRAGRATVPLCSRAPVIRRHRSRRCCPSRRLPLSFRRLRHRPSVRGYPVGAGCASACSVVPTRTEP